MPGPLGRFLERTFRSTEEANRQAIVALADPRPGGRLLDCGCGDGEFSMALAARHEAREVHGIEAVPDRVRTAAGRGMIVAQADLEARWPYPDGHFDVVHANQLLEHLRQSDHFLRELRRVLAPGGYALISTNNLASWHNVVSLMLGYQPPPMHVSNEVVLGNPLDPLRGHRFGAPEDSHLRIYSFRALRDLAEYHGFRVAALRTAGYYPLPPALARMMTRLDRRHGVFLIAKLAPA